MASEYRPSEEYETLLSGMSGDEFFNSLQDTLPPGDLSPLPFSDDLAGRLRLPITQPLAFPRLRRDIVAELGDMVADKSLGLHADQGTVQDLRFGLSEGVQNAFRNNNGVYQLDIRRTAAGGLYTAVHNISVTYPPEPVLHHRPGQRPLRLNSHASSRRQLGLADDEHGWGLGLISQVVSPGPGPGMGFYREQIASIQNISTGQTVEITRLVFWAMYARSQSQGLAQAA